MSTTTDKKLNKKELAELTPEVTKNVLDAEQLMELVNEKFDQVATKSAMLKLIRSEGFSAAQNRVYAAYLNIEKVRNSKEVK